MLRFISHVRVCVHKWNTNYAYYVCTVLALKACMSESRDELCIFALTLAASSDVPSLASTVACSHSMSSVMGVCSCMREDYCNSNATITYKKKQQCYA